MRRKSLVPVFVFCLVYLIWAADINAATAEFDFGLPLFGMEEIKFEASKDPSFNLQLFEKYLSENSESEFHFLHAVSRWMSLVSFSGSAKKEKLTQLALKRFESKSFEKLSKLEALALIFLRGLILANNEDEHENNVKDHAFEDLLLKAESVLGETPHYWLVKGILFHRLRNRPNRFFAPMRPLEDLKRAAGMAPPKNAHYYFVLGQAFRAIDTDEAGLFLAIASYEKASSIAPGNVRLQNTLFGIYMGLHESFRNQGKPEPFWLEEAVYKKILTVSPNDPHALNNLGYLYAEYGIHRDLAQKLCQRAVDQVPGNAGFRDSLGWAAFKNGNFQKAVTELKKSIAINSDSYDAHYHLATVYYVNKDYDEAIAAFKKALELKPNAAEALNNYAYLLAELDKDIAGAFEMARKAVKLEPNNPSYIDTLGWLHYRQKEFPQALELLHRAAQIAPDVGEILFHIGKIQLEMGKFTEAVEFLEKALKADPKFENIEDELFLAVNLKAHYSAIADFHRMFGSKARIEHLKSMLLSLLRIYQDNGQFKKAMEITAVCDELHAGTRNLSTPLFDFYTLEVEPGEKATDANPEKPDGSSAEVVAPPRTTPLAKIDDDIPIAVHIGPSLVRSLCRYLPVSEIIQDLSISLFAVRLGRPARNFCIQFELPDMKNRAPIKVLEYYLQMLGCSELNTKTEYWGYPGLSAKIGRMPIWAIHAENRFIVGTYDTNDKIDLEIMSLAFPYDRDSFLGLVVNWQACSSDIPKFLLPMIGNPIRPFQLIHSRYYRERENLREISLLLPDGVIDRSFMNSLARNLYAYKLLMRHYGIEVAINAKAGEGCVEINAQYVNILASIRNRLKTLSIFAPIFRSRLEKLMCVIRRATFGGSMSKLGEICPSKGTVTVNAPGGYLECSVHGRSYIFPLLTEAKQRCDFSLMRLNELMKVLGEKLKTTKEKENLLNKIILDYNIPPCPLSGNYTFDEASGCVRCSHHCGSPEQKKK